VSIRAYRFRGDGSDEPVELGGEGAIHVAADELLWVDAVAPDPSEVAAICRALRLTDRAAAALETAPAEPAATIRDGGVEVVIGALVDGAAGDATAVRTLVGDGWIVTQHDRQIPFLESFGETLRDDRPVGQLSAVQLLVSLLDWHVDSFFSAAEELEVEVDALDDAALRTERDLLSRLVAMRRRIASVRRVMSPHREVLAELVRPDFLPDLEGSEKEALAGVATRLERAGDAIANTREMLIGTFDVHMTRTAQRTNDIMRVLTLASVIFLPSVVLAGIMGMNFKVGLFEEPNLFWVVIGVMLSMGLATLGIARWRGWL
jgi:magnesium transporter